VFSINPFVVIRYFFDDSFICFDAHPSSEFINYVFRINKSLLVNQHLLASSEVINL